jgi:hypothetical protein
MGSSWALASGTRTIRVRLLHGFEVCLLLYEICPRKWASTDYPMPPNQDPQNWVRRRLVSTASRTTMPRSGRFVLPAPRSSAGTEGGHTWRGRHEPCGRCLWGGPSRRVRAGPTAAESGQGSPPANVMTSPQMQTLQRNLSRSSAGLRAEPLANGIRKVDLQGRFLHATVLEHRTSGQRRVCVDHPSAMADLF